MKFSLLFLVPFSFLPFLIALKQFKIKSPHELGNAGAASAFDGTADLALAFGCGDVFEIVRKNIGEALTRDGLLLVDAAFDGGDDTLERAHLRK